MKTLNTFFLLILMASLSFGQSKTVADFETTADGQKHFLYQSVIRLMNKDKNPDFNMLIRNLDHLRFISSEADEAKAKNTFLELDNGVQGEGFAEIMRFDHVDSKCRVYEMETSRGQSTWVVTLLMDDVAAAMEMKGSLDLKYIDALRSLNQERVSEMLSLDKKEKTEDNKQ